MDEASLNRARRLVGLKGYVTNIPADLATASEIIGNYHDLWRVEQSFRMSKTDLRARPMFHHTRDAIEAHLTIVFAALAVARYLQHETGLSNGSSAHYGRCKTFRSNSPAIPSPQHHNSATKHERSSTR